ncbi:uncharacterized protein LOC110114268 [Dendrobium catenatum]|uniref:Tyrosyl-DNA phosphodiesterase 1 n=1 Tax=Dendrobium catenatum TaxID=906689 RepID=A0A2I0VAV1_9ASPA|nr:uncharacterized protein LOC110114268 [Dendrobium catenatum]PKU60534.1 hypothetical protein MA16_Dca028687 [Dendrobium catenatum]
MHVKVARRRFQSSTSTSAFGWIYCGSHNFSPAAWGRLLPPSTVEAGSAARLRIFNYELGILLIVPPPSKVEGDSGNLCNLDDFQLPFVMPAPRYCGGDRPATAFAMRGAVAELTEQDCQGMDEEDVADEEVIGPSEYVAEESEDDKIYAEMLWSQVGSSDGF